MLSKTKKRSLAEKLSAMDSAAQDFDPEDDFPQSEQDSASDEDEDLGREHYETVEKSKLRKPATVALGLDYRGSKISRDDLDDSEEDENDPFNQAYAETDSEDQLDLNQDDMDDEEDGDDNDAYEEFDDMADDSDEHMGSNGVKPQAEFDPKAATAAFQKAVTSTLSQSAQIDVEKGQAIKAQRNTFDKLLGIRIKLQKALIAANSLSTEPSDPEASIKGAEAAAFRLLETLDSLRATFTKELPNTGEKRKRSQISSSDSLSQIWAKLDAHETPFKQKRNSTLDLWANKTRADRTVIQRNRLHTSSSDNQSLSEVLSLQMMDMNRLIEKTEVPRSCAPLQAQDSSIPSSNLPIYDDADFYGVLLQTLISQRGSDVSMNPNLVMQPWQVAREAKTRKKVDTKASKGRRLRYTVHEKLQDSMARQDRTSWSTRQCDELFASLLGRSIQLKDVESEDDLDENIEGLRLFAS